MEIVAVNNNMERLNEIATVVHVLFPNAILKPFTDPLMSIKYVYNNHVSMAIVEADMRPASGIDMLHVLRKGHLKLPVVIISDKDTPQYAAAAKEADLYLIRPFNQAQLCALREIAKGKA